MKKNRWIMLTVAAVTGGFLFSACNKDYDCVCKVNGQEVQRYSVREKTKNRAEDECNQKQSSLGVTYQCYIE